MIKRTIALLLASASLSIASTKSVYKIWQPLSLHGTDVDSVVGAESGVDYAVLMSRPVVLSDALPEGLVYAISMKHKMPSVGGYNEPEANLLELFQIKLNARLSEEKLDVTIDVKNAVTPAGVEVSLTDTVQLTVTAIRRTLDAYGIAYLEDGIACTIRIIGDEKAPNLAALQKFNTKFIIEAPAPQDVE